MRGDERGAEAIALGVELVVDVHDATLEEDVVDASHGLVDALFQLAIPALHHPAARGEAEKRARVVGMDVSLRAEAIGKGDVRNPDAGDARRVDRRGQRGWRGGGTPGGNPDAADVNAPARR